MTKLRLTKEGQEMISKWQKEEIATLRAQNAELREALEIALHRADQARYHTAEAIQPITAEWLDGIITEARRVLEKTNAK